MRLLLDTHVFLWAVAGSSKLTPALRRTMETADAVFVSAASLWEIAIKVALGKIEADAQALVRAIDASGFIELPVRVTHAVAVMNLPAHHRDPFDRLLVAQALTEPLRLLTVDPALAGYSDVVLRV